MVTIVLGELSILQLFFKLLNEMRCAKSFTVCLLCLLPLLGFGQQKCSANASIISIKEIQGEGIRVEFEIISKGAFKAKLVSSKTGYEEIVKEFSGNGNDRVFVTNLNKDLYYRVIFEFVGETNFLCKTRVLPDIFSIDSYKK